MATLRTQERLQPALLDRLTDDEPGSLQEAVESRVINRNRLRELVLRDLAWLLNAPRLRPTRSTGRRRRRRATRC